MWLLDYLQNMPSPSLSSPPQIPQIAHQFLNRTWYSWVLYRSIIFIPHETDLDFSSSELHRCNQIWKGEQVEFFWSILLQVLAVWPLKLESESPIKCLTNVVYHLCVMVHESLLKRNNCNSEWPVELGQCTQAVNYLLQKEMFQQFRHDLVYHDK